MASSAPVTVSQRGFTLLEVLVVLAITSLLSVLLIDGVSQVLMIEQRMGLKTREFRTEQLQEHWVRQVISGALASNDDPFFIEEGRIGGLTLSPLVADQGVPTHFELALVSGEQSMELRYTENDATYTLMRLDSTQMRDLPRILALQDDGTYASSWRSKQRGPQWPPGIALRVPWLDGDLIWHVAVEGRRTPRPRVDESLGI